MISANDRYDEDLQKFRSLIVKDSEAALDQFGISMLYSLNPAERVSALRGLGYEANEAKDFYNLGVHAIQEDNWTEAIVNFKQAIDLDNTMTEAIFNLAICYEKTGHTPQAIQTFEIFLDVTEDENDKAAVQEHITELQ